MFESLKEKFTGDLDSAKLKKEIADAPTALVEKNFGWLGGRVYFIKPNDNNAKAIANLWNELDHHKKGRVAASTPSWFVGGGNFILERTGPEGQANHNLFIQSLKRPSDYIGFTKNALNKYLEGKREANLRDLAIEPIRNALASGMFDTDGLTPEFANALKGFSEIIQDMADDFSYGVFMNLVGAYYTKLLNLNPQFVRARNQYVDSIDDFLASQADHILSDLHKFAIEGKKLTNIISLSIIQLLKEKHPMLVHNQEDLTNYLISMDTDDLMPLLKNSYIRTVPGALSAGDNTMIILSCGLVALSESPALMTELRDAINAVGITNDSTPDEIEAAIKKDKADSGPLHRFYLECMRRETLLKTPEHLRYETMSLRHADTDITFEGETIKANSMVIILSGMPRFDERKWQDPAAFNPSRFFAADGKSLDDEKAKISRSIFSTGSRMCPANFVTEYIFKSFISQLAMNYDFKLTRDNPEVPLDKVNDQKHVTVQLLPVAEAKNDKVIEEAVLLRHSR